MFMCASTFFPMLLCCHLICSLLLHTTQCLRHNNWHSDKSWSISSRAISLSWRPPLPRTTGQSIHCTQQALSPCDVPPLHLRMACGGRRVGHGDRPWRPWPQVEGILPPQWGPAPRRRSRETHGGLDDMEADPRPHQPANQLCVPVGGIVGGGSVAWLACGAAEDHLSHVGLD